jgi:hypothetical protein
MGIKPSHKEIIENIILNFVNIEMSFYKELEKSYEESDITSLLLVGFTNYIGNFIFFNSSAESRKNNLKIFIESLHEWFDQMEEKEKLSIKNNTH